MTVSVAFYRYPRGGHTWWKYLHHRIVCWWTRGAYSHAELVLSERVNEVGVLDYECASSSPRDGGVRTKWMDLPADKWTLIAVPADANVARAWFVRENGKGYDYLAWVGFVWRRETGSKNRWFCSEAIASALGMSEPWRYDPNTLYAILSACPKDKNGD